MPKLQAAVPPGAPPNALLRVRLPDGNVVNVRIPKGLKPGEEFIFEVDTLGGVVKNGCETPTIAEGVPKNNSSGGGVGGKKNDKSHHGSHKHVSKNPKKKSRGTHSDSSQHHGVGLSSINSKARNGGSLGFDHSNHGRAASGRQGIVPSFVTEFFNIYNQVYDVLCQFNESAESSKSTPSSSMSPSQRKTSLGNVSIHSSPISQRRESSLSSPILDRNNDFADDKKSSQLDVDTDESALFVTPHHFLDKEIASRDGLIITLLASTFIGTSILLGFLGGVLYVTPVDNVIQGRW